VIDYRCKIEAGAFYHIFNRGNNGENIFYTKENYSFFLRRYEHFMADYVDTFAFCLLPNHFHLLIRMKPIINVSHLQNEKHLECPVSKQFQGLFTSYAKAINKQETRTGSLFQHPFKRIKVDTEIYLRQLVVYIHNNPVKHGFANFPEQWAFSSYNSILTDKSGILEREQVIKWFDDLTNFKAVHTQSVQIIRELQLEE